MSSCPSCTVPPPNDDKTNRLPLSPVGGNIGAVHFSVGLSSALGNKGGLNRAGDKMLSCFKYVMLPWS